MRVELEKLKGLRVAFTGKVTKYGRKRSYKGNFKQTVLLTNVRFKDNNKEATDHIWLTVGVKLSNIELEVGEEIEFTAIIREYHKGYINKNKEVIDQKLDYKLIYPANIKRIQKNLLIN
jgi:hypothetical protein